MGTEKEFELTYIPAQTVLEVVHVQQSEGDDSFELGVDLNGLMHTQQLFAEERDQQNKQWMSETHHAGIEKYRQTLISETVTYFCRYSSESHSFK